MQEATPKLHKYAHEILIISSYISFFIFLHISPTLYLLAHFSPWNYISSSESQRYFSITYYSYAHNFSVQNPCFLVPVLFKYLYLCIIIINNVLALHYVRHQRISIFHSSIFPELKVFGHI